MHSRTALPMGVDVIVRLHDPKRLIELDQALFSLLNQTFHPVHPIVVTQAFSDEMTAEVRSLINRFDWQERGHQQPSIINVAAPAGLDIRAQLLNVGVGSARNRFLAFLDGDDYLYGHAYEYLVNQALSSGAALTFGGIVCRHIRVFEQFVFSAKESRDVFRGQGLRDLQTANFCPIHSFIVDRNQVAPDDLVFNPGLTRLEDYDFLLRVSTRYTTHFKSRAQTIGIYNWHLDGRGSIQYAEADPARAAENKRAWNSALRHIWRLKTLLRDSRTTDASDDTQPSADWRHRSRS
jgi:hypothetical protein